MMKREWKFRVKACLRPGESVCVTGSCHELGNWMSRRAFVLHKELEEEDEKEVWSGTVRLPANTVIEFRYLTAIVIEPSDENESREIIVRKWETNLRPRIVHKDASHSSSGFVAADDFGTYDRQTKIETGWLTAESVIQLKLYYNAIHIWKKKFEARKIRVKLTPVNIRQNVASETGLVGESMDESMECHDSPSLDHWCIVEYAKMDKEEYSFRTQEQFGQVFHPSDFLVFQIQALDPESVAFMMDFYLHSQQDLEARDIPRHIGSCYILPSNLKSSVGITIVPIASPRHHPIGQLTVEHLLVTPIKDLDCDMHISYANHWKHSWRGLDVGHRGIGNSFRQHHLTADCANVRENTIASLNLAVSHGADFVEFDVQLSKDRIPVLYHDFHVLIAMKKKKSVAEHDMLELPLKDLTLEQLQKLKVYHLEEKHTNERFSDEDYEDHQPFPTLQKALEVIDPHVGFNIEIKWTMQLKDGTFELYHPMELNLYLDILLTEILKYGANRKIILSCFHPDICTMIRLKQNKYPVMFLTQGVTMKYPEYNDPRTQTIPMGVYFALSSGLLGINVHTEDILRDPSQVEFTKTNGLILFCWGDDNNDVDRIKYLKKLGLDGIIYDRIDEYNSKEVKESIFLVEAREAQMEILGVAAESSGAQNITAVTNGTSNGKASSNSMETSSESEG